MPPSSGAAFRALWRIRLHCCAPSGKGEREKPCEAGTGSSRFLSALAAGAVPCERMRSRNRKAIQTEVGRWGMAGGRTARFPASPRMRMGSVRWRRERFSRLSGGSSGEKRQHPRCRTLGVLFQGLKRDSVEPSTCGFVLRLKKMAKMRKFELSHFRIVFRPQHGCHINSRLNERSVIELPHSCICSRQLHRSSRVL